MSDSKVPLPDLDQDSATMHPVDSSTVPENTDTSRGAADLSLRADGPG